MNHNDLRFAQAFVRALNMVAAAAKDWLRDKVDEVAKTHEQKQIESQDQNPRQ